MSATVFYADAAEIATLQNVFAVSGVATDPTTVTCTVTDPSGTATVHTYNGAAPADITRVSAGTFTLAVPSILDGIWIYKWTGTGAASDVQEGTWTVGPSDLSRLYCTTEELRSRLGLASTGRDFELAIAVSAACRGVDGYCERYFWRGADTRTYVPDDRCRVRVDDIASGTGLTVKVDHDGDGTYEETWTQGTDYQLLPLNPNRTGEPRPYTKIGAVGSLTFPWPRTRLPGHPDRVQVAGPFGWPATPAAVKTGSLITAAELFRMGDLPLGGEIPGEMSALVIATIASNPVTAAMLGPYRRSPFPVA